MKRIITALAIAVVIIGGAALISAQSVEIITLNDATPGVDLVVSLPPGTAGAMSLEFKEVAVTLMDANGQIIFRMAEPRAQGLDLEFAPDLGAHTLHLERLPGVSETQVAVMPRDALQPTLATTVIDGTALTLNQIHETTLSATNPTESLSVAIPNGIIGKVQGLFYGEHLAAQISDSAGTPVATLAGESIDGFSIYLSSGNYDLMLLNPNPAIDAEFQLSVEQGNLVNELVAVSAPQTNSDDVAAAGMQQNVSANGAETGANVNNVAACTITIGVSSINLRSGPGTAYAVDHFGYQGDVYQVGGTSQDGTWLLIGGDSIGSAWMSGRFGALAGNCNSLTRYDMPVRTAPEPEVIELEAEIIELEPDVITVVSSGGGGGGGGGSDHSSSSSNHDDDDDDYEDHDEHEEHEEREDHEDDHDEHEHEDDD